MQTKKMARFALVAVAVFGIVGAGLALKANTKMRGATIFCSTAPTQSATSVVPNFTINTLPEGLLSYCTTIVSRPASTTYITVLD
jgi:hypothetical protein